MPLLKNLFVSPHLGRIYMTKDAESYRELWEVWKIRWPSLKLVMQM